MGPSLSLPNESISLDMSISNDIDSFGNNNEDISNGLDTFDNDNEEISNGLDTFGNDIEGISNDIDSFGNDNESSLSLANVSLTLSHFLNFFP